MKRPILKMLVAAFAMFLVSPLVSCASMNPDIESVSSSQGTIVRDENSVVVIEGPVEEGTSVMANELVQEDKEAALAFLNSGDYDTEGKTYVYDISLLKDGVAIQPSGTVKVSIAIPDIDIHLTYNVFHLGERQSVERITPVVTVGNVSFETSGFSVFIIAPEAEDAPLPSSSEDPIPSLSSTEEPKKEVLVSINILPLAAYGTLEVNGKVLEGAASYKTTHLEGDVLNVRAIPAEGHHFDYWGEDGNVLSRETSYEFTVGKTSIHFAANFTEGHVVTYSNITDDSHTERCRYCDYSATLPHTYLGETVIRKATCQEPGQKESACACGKTKVDEIPMTAHDYQSGVCSNCGDIEVYVRCDRNGVANPEGAYVKMGYVYERYVRDATISNALWDIVGSPWMTEFANWTPFDFGNGDAYTTYYADATYGGVSYRGIVFDNYRLDNDMMQVSGSSRWHSGSVYWFERRSAMWRIVKEQDGLATLLGNNIWISERFAESAEGTLTYENSWIRSWLQTYQNELFNESQKAILQPNANCYGDKIFLPSYDEVGLHHNIEFGYYDYPKALGAFYDVVSGMGATYCPYWLRDRISTEEDGLNYVECVPSHAPFDATVKYPANKTFVAAVPSVIIRL